MFFAATETHGGPDPALPSPQLANIRHPEQVHEDEHGGLGREPARRARALLPAPDTPVNGQRGRPGRRWRRGQPLQVGGADIL